MLKANDCKLHRQHCPRLTSKDVRPMIYSFRNLPRRGLTLIEILIALTMTLIVLGAMAQAFKFASAEIADGRAILEMSNRLRNAQQLLRTDLAGLTVEVRPHIDTPPNGYFEYVEGLAQDSDELGTANGYLGDWDDVLAFTSRNLDGTFRGRRSGEILLSTFAEIIWFTEALDINSDGIAVDGADTPLYSDTVALHRRVLIVRPDLNDSLTQTDENDNPLVGIGVASSEEEVVDFLANNDVSVRIFELNDGQFLIVANSLSDLARRENRFARLPIPFTRAGREDAFPHPIEPDLLGRTKMVSQDRLSGNETLMTDVAAFDVQIYSPDSLVALVDVDNDGVDETALNRSDLGFSNFTATATNNGGFIDLASAGGPFDRAAPRFSTQPVRPTNEPRTNLGVPLWDVPTLCTWSPHYEADGLDQNDDGVFDSATDGLDNDGINGVDDAGFDGGNGERETLPPYLYPARGLKVTLRIIEKKSKQVRQATVVQNFLPQ